TASVSAAQKATDTIPIVMGSAGDPVENGFVKSLARPGGNITGITSLMTEISPKHLEMLRSLHPRLSRVAVLLEPTNPSHPAVLRSLQTAAQRISVTVLPREVQAAREIEAAFSEMARQNARAVIVAPAPLFNQQRRQIAELAAKHRL